MKGRAPALLILLLIAGVAVLVAVVLFMGQRQELARLQQQLVLSQQQAAFLESEKRTLSDELTGLQGERKGLEQRVASLRTELTGATAELDRSRAALRELQDRAGTIEGERNQLQQRLADVITEREEARQRSDRLAQEKADLGRAVVRLRERMTLLDQDYRRLAEKLAETSAAGPAAPHPGVSVVSQYDPAAPAAAQPPAPAAAPPPADVPQAAGSVELPPIVVRKDRTETAASLRGRLVEVNDVHQFVVLDKGSVDGVRAGMAFDLLRGTQRVGRATAVRVRPNLSACDIVRAKTPGPLQVGDHAVQSGL